MDKIKTKAYACYMHMLFIKKGRKMDILNIFLYIIIFTMGTLFGSFYSLAVYRLPKGLDIVKTHSFCPNCNHKLGFFELIPVWSYIILNGKCKNCKQKIRPRYLILEILSGLVFVLLAYSLKINVYSINAEISIRYAFTILYFVAIFIIAGIDQEKRKIEKSVLYYGVIVSCAYIIYLCIMEKNSIYRYVMYLVILIILLIIDALIQTKKAKDSYFLETLILLCVMCINTGVIVTIFTVVSLLILEIIKYVIKFIKNKTNKTLKTNIDILKNIKNIYLLCIMNIIIYFIFNSII